MGSVWRLGKLTAGSDACIENIKKGKAFLIILSEDASQNTKEKFRRISEQHNTKIIEFGEKIYLSKSIGKVDKVVFAILDKGFSDKILQLLKELKGAIK